MYDIMIIGGGPAGLTAAVYAGRAEKSALVIEKDAFGGQITHSPRVENIPGFVSLSGNEFAEKLVDQAIAQGAEFESGEVTELRRDPETGLFTAVTEFGEFEGKAVIIATGAKHRELGLPREHELEGVSYCAVCDGAFYKGMDVGVVGGGNSALQEAVLLSGLCRKVTIFQNLPVLTGEKKLQEELAAKDNVEVICGVHVEKLLGENELSGVVLKKLEGGEELEVPVQGLFVAIGLLPQNEPFTDWIDLNPWGYADSDETCVTKTPGLFTAGDCRSKRIRQVTTAAADGAVAALKAIDFTEGRV
ncbi:MAG: FAD-dependent oxidoreductase [Lachnospiraceae bacterium]|nr:FAD-dependent oxidoreductase [Lachnospiraceae bacterium]